MRLAGDTARRRQRFARWWVGGVLTLASVTPATAQEPSPQAVARQLADVILFVEIEGRRLAIRRRWLPIAATCPVGVSCGLPLFLYQRQVQLDRAGA